MTPFFKTKKDMTLKNGKVVKKGTLIPFATGGLV